MRPKKKKEGPKGKESGYTPISFQLDLSNTYHPDTQLIEYMPSVQTSYICLP